MARAALAHTQASRAGTVVTETTPVAADGVKITNDGKVYVLAHNSGATGRLITFQTPGTVDGQAVADRTDTVAAGVTKLYGPFPTSDYGTTLNVDVAHAELHLVAIH